MAIIHIDLEIPNRYGNDPPAGDPTIFDDLPPDKRIVVLSGDVPVWKYCIAFHKLLQEGVGVVAIGHKFNMETEGGCAMVVHSTNKAYPVGEPMNNDRLNRRDQTNEDKPQTPYNEMLQAAYKPRLSLSLLYAKDPEDQLQSLLEFYGHYVSETDPEKQNEIVRHINKLLEASAQRTG